MGTLSIMNIAYLMREIVERETPSTQVRFEAGADLNLKPRTIGATRRAFEFAGVVFVDENGYGPGARVRNKPTPK